MAWTDAESNLHKAHVSNWPFILASDKVPYRTCELIEGFVSLQDGVASLHKGLVFLPGVLNCLRKAFQGFRQVRRHGHS